MNDDNTRTRLVPLAWVVVFLASGFLGGDTVHTMMRVGLFGLRPPLSVAQTVLRIVIVLTALALLHALHGRLERIALLIAAAAASSSALYGIGLRAAVLSAFRLLSHLGAYALIMVVASQKVAIAFRQPRDTSEKAPRTLRRVAVRWAHRRSTGRASAGWRPVPAIDGVLFLNRN